MPRDRYDPDGVISAGTRLVRKLGMVKFGGNWWQSDELLPYVGKRVRLMMSCYWNTECFAYDPTRAGSMWICNLRLGDKAPCEEGE